MAKVTAMFGAAMDDATLHGGVIGEPRRFAALKGDLPFDVLGGAAIRWIAESARPVMSRCTSIAPRM